MNDLPRANLYDCPNYTDPKTPKSKPGSLTELVKSRFSPATAERFLSPDTIQSASGVTAEGFENSLVQENNLFLKDIVKNNKVTMAVLTDIYNDKQQHVCTLIYVKPIRALGGVGRSKGCRGQ